MFLTTDEEVLINEIAPRPHNSGHYSIEACRTSQFEQLVRILCGLPMGAVTMSRPAAMANLLGDLWFATDGKPDWKSALDLPGVSLHLYGKKEAREGRKMGHLTVIADDVDEAEKLALEARRRAMRTAQS
jgi:5-(carboxyamino)imidazole ribonucleotide synthase